MNNLTHLSDFSVPLALEPHRQAEKFRQQQPTPQKAKQVYLNTLAIYAAQFYLECSGFEPDLASSDGLNPVKQMLLGTSAISLKQIGQLECCPVLTGATEFEIAPEVRQDRLGYIAVRLDDSLRTATLLGFVTEAADVVQLSQLQPIEALAQQLVPLISPTTARPTTTRAGERITQLSQWLQNLADESWQALDTLLSPAQPAFAFRNQTTTAEPPNPVVGRSKQLSLNNHKITLTVGILPLSATETEIWVQVAPTGEQAYLPPQLKLMVLDTTDNEVMQAEARGTEVIQLKFSGCPGEQFSLKVALHNASISETFVI
ncbi:MAG: DUF1822 family protein [Cyanobacteria bacterium P01_F01_bin.4]